MSLSGLFVSRTGQTTKFPLTGYFIRLIMAAYCMKDFLSTAILLFIVIDPVGLAPMIQGMLKKYPPARQRRILARELIFALIILLLFFFSGQFLLDLLGLKPATLNISGGILLFLVALGMVFPSKDPLSSEANRPEEDEPFIVPIAMPLMAGPSSLAIIMLHASQSPDSFSKFAYAAAIVTAWLASGATLFIAQKFLSLLGTKGTITLERMMGMILIMISVQMLLNGLADYSFK